MFVIWRCKSAASRSHFSVRRRRGTGLNQSVSADKCLCGSRYVIVPCRRVTFQHADFQVNRPTRSARDVPSCHLPWQAASPGLRGISMAWSWHCTARTCTQLSGGRRRAVFLFYFFYVGGGWVCSWAGGAPRAVGCTRKNSQTTACHQIPLCPMGGLRGWHPVKEVLGWVL